MSSVFRWPSGTDPFAPLRQMAREFERVFGRGLGGEGRGIGGGTYPPVNVFNGPNDTIVQCELAGVAKDNVDVSITGETVVIKGTKKPLADDDKLHFLRRERGAGEFNRTVILPDEVDASRVEARLADGVLTICLPKSESAKPRRVSVK